MSEKIGRHRASAEGWIWHTPIMSFCFPAFMAMDLSTSMKDQLRIFPEVAEEQARVSWQTDLTDPGKHNPQDFRYVVHGLQDPGGRALQFHHLTGRPEAFDRTQAIDLLRQPERIADKKVISASVVDAQHRATWGAVGYILDVPFENVVAAFRRDAGTPFIAPERALSERTGAPAIREILKETHPHSHNEVVLRGSTEEGRVSVAGVWAKVFDDGEPLNEQMYQEIRSKASLVGFPFIELIEQVEPYQDSSPELLGGWAIMHQGLKMQLL